MKTLNLVLIAPLLLLLITGCDKNDNPSSQTIYGKAVTLGEDSIRAFVTLDDGGDPQTIGLQFGENALKGLPTDTMPGMPHYMHIVAIPEQGKMIGVDHFEVDWNPLGHEPKAIYGVPHFDFHFYYIKSEEQAKIAGGPDTVPVPAQYIPKDYIVPVPFAVPYMGVHWFDSTAAEFHGQPFTATFIYGFYHGEMIFLEPMITKAYLETRPDVSVVIKQPVAFQKSNYYPVSYQVKYDTVKHVYLLTFSGLIKHV